MSTERVDEALLIMRSLSDEYDQSVNRTVKQLKDKFKKQRESIDAIGTMVKMSGLDVQTSAILLRRLQTIVVTTASLMLDKFDETKSSLATMIIEELNESSEVLNGKKLISDEEAQDFIKQLFTPELDYQMECEIETIVDNARLANNISFSQPHELIMSAISDADEDFVSNIISVFTKAAKNIFTDVVRLTIRDKNVKCVTVTPCDVTTKAECWFVHGTDINLTSSFTTHGSGCKCVPLFYLNGVAEEVKSIKSADEAFELLKTYEAKSVLGDGRYAKWLKGDSLNVLLTVDEDNSEQA
jgi:hypothetical protein